MLEDRAEREEDAKERPRKDFMDECKGSRHTAESAVIFNTSEGTRKSSGTCRKEWKALSESTD